MSSFTKPLIAKKLDDGRWEIVQEFIYFVGKEDSEDKVVVPAGFKTDFASVPRALWMILPPDGPYTKAAVVHDYLYAYHQFDRKKSDGIFLEAMTVLGVSWWKRKAMYRAVRMFGGLVWNKYRNQKKELKV